MPLWCSQVCVHKNKIQRDRHLLPSQQNAEIGDTVSVKMPPQTVEPGFYIAIGDNGSIKDLQSKHIIVNVYCNVNSIGALALMDRLTICDTAILSLTSDDYARVQPLLASIYRETQSYFQPQIPLFTKYLAPGLALAERPLANGSLSKNLTFAQHRFQLVAQGLITAWKADRQTPEAKLQYICDRFARAGISLSQPYLNPDSNINYNL